MTRSASTASSATVRAGRCPKPLGNGIDPLEVIAQYGADALRFMLVDGSTPGNDMRYSEKKVEAARNFRQ